MRFFKTPIDGAYRIELDAHADERGLFARTFCRDEFREHGLFDRIAQENVSFNVRKGTLRGMHLQNAPHGEDKVVRCTRGAVFDVAIDLRASSHTYLHWHGIELSADARTMFYLPKGIAHGFLTLTAETELHYLMSQPYVPGYGRGVRWNDPAFAINWPFEPQVISDRDAGWPDWTDIRGSIVTE